MDKQIEKAQWDAFLADFDKTHHGYDARLEIVGKDFGDQEETAWLPFSGISYDPHGDQIIITVGGISRRYPAHLTHSIAKPTQLVVHQPHDEKISSILIVASDNTETLVHLWQQPQLAPAGAASE